MKLSLILYLLGYLLIVCRFETFIFRILFLYFLNFFLYIFLRILRRHELWEWEINSSRMQRWDRESLINYFIKMKMHRRQATWEARTMTIRKMWEVAYFEVECIWHESDHKIRWILLKNQPNSCVNNVDLSQSADFREPWFRFLFTLNMPTLACTYSLGVAIVKIDLRYNYIVSTSVLQSQWGLARHFVSHWVAEKVLACSFTYN